MKFKFFLITLLTVCCATSQNNIATQDYLLTNNNIKLPGVLHYSKNVELQPLAIFIHGSGPTDRNGGPANYIKQLADTWVTQGIAFYRYDKRTSNRDNVTELLKGFEFNDFVDDVRIAIDTFSNDNRFSSITLIGHSQGSLIGMLASGKNVNKYLSLAGPSETIDKTIIKQVTAQNPQLGKTTIAHFKELKKTGTVKKPDPNLLMFFAKRGLELLSSWMSYNPVEEIKKVMVPTLIINGTRDLQVSIKDAEELNTAKPDSKLVIIGNMTHSNKEVFNDKDTVKSLTNPKYKLSNRLVTTLIDFIKD